MSLLTLEIRDLNIEVETNRTKVMENDFHTINLVM